LLSDTYVFRVFGCTQLRRGVSVVQKPEGGRRNQRRHLQIQREVSGVDATLRPEPFDVFAGTTHHPESGVQVRLPESIRTVCMRRPEIVEVEGNTFWTCAQERPGISERCHVSVKDKDVIVFIAFGESVFPEFCTGRRLLTPSADACAALSDESARIVGNLSGIVGAAVIEDNDAIREGAPCFERGAPETISFVANERSDNDVRHG
jgi:hypothetical protein